MAEHNELVAEMPILEQMGTQERQKLAKKRRLQQLKKWGQREKEWIAKEKQLNKRLASKLNEESNGLNLKQYTTYSSNHRSKKKLQNSTSALNINNINNNNNNINNNNTSNFNNHKLYSINSSTIPDSNLNSNGRVHFNVGVMLLEAAARNDFDEVKRLLMLGVSPDSINHDGLTALHQCCIDASEPIMNLLLEFGANVDAKDTEKWTPLHAACTCGHLNLVEILVENGANLLAVNGDGNMPFDICEDEATLDYIESQMVKRGITQEMIDFTRASTEMQMISDLEKQVADGKDLNSADDSGVTPLHIAAANGYLSAVKFLLKHGVNVNVCDNDLWRPLHGVACWGNEQHSKVVELLVEAGADMNAKTVNDETVFDLCDNSELLGKLNQLKDELESKQATSTDRLRRTQSRTNSRVHSVRRTSVRDKNQISRREAREEALLRVENSPTVSATATTTATAINNAPSNGLSNQIEETLNVGSDLNGNNRQTSESSVESSNSLTLNNKQSALNPSSDDQVDSGLSTKERLTVSLTQSNSSFGLQTASSEAKLNSSCGLEKKKQDSDNSHVTPSRSQNSPICASSNDFIANNNLKQHPTNKHNTSFENAELSPSSISFNLKQNNNLKQPTKSSPSSKNRGDVDNLDVELELNRQSSQDNQSQPSNSQSHITIVQLAPINYTLSNLKKQRSDLRMRTTSIGGGIISNLNGFTSKDDNQVALNPQPLSLPVNSADRPISPSSTFRKFSGEPSEVIGGKERSKRHNCCTLI